MREFELSSNTFSTNGRLVQLDYASKAVENGNLSLALKCKGCVVLATCKPEPPSGGGLGWKSKRIYSIEKEREGEDGLLLFRATQG